MKFHLLFFSLIFFTKGIIAQDLFIYENKVIDKAVPRTSKSYSSRFIHLSNSDVKIYEDIYRIGMKWQPISRNEVIGCNVWLIGRIDLMTNHLDTIHYDRYSNILELSANPNTVIFLETSNEMLRFEDYKLVKYDLRTRIKSQVLIKGTYAITNLSLSVDGKYLAFIDVKNSIPSMCILDLASSKIKIIENGNVGGLEGNFGMNWNGNIFQYCIRTKEGIKQRRYDPTLGELTTEQIDFKAVEDFKYGIRTGTNNYVINGDKIQRLENETWVTIYASEYKYDFLGNQICIIAN